MKDDFEEAIANMCDDAGKFLVPPSHRAAVLEGLEQAKRREFVDDHEMKKLWKKCGL